MQEFVLVQDLAIVMVISAITLVVCFWLRLPVVLGYILAGFLIGPNTPPYSLVTDQHNIHTLSELGIIFLLFSIGLEFSFTKLSRLGAGIFIATTVEIMFMFLLGYGLASAFGWKHLDRIFLGAIVSISSTTIIGKILMEGRMIKEKFAQGILGILVVEDLWAIVMITVLTGLVTTGGFSFGEVSLSMVKVFAFVIAVLFFGLLAVPHVLRYVERVHKAEVMVVVVLGLCLGSSLLAAKAGLSIALGAFLVGAVIAECKQAHDIVVKMEPIRDMFTAIFFVSVGMLIEPRAIADNAFLITILCLVVIIGKITACSLVTFLRGYEAQTALRVGLGLAQIGEFSFIIAQMGHDANVTQGALYPIAVAVSAITTVSTPFFMKNSAGIIGVLKKMSPRFILTFTDFYPSWVARLAQAQGDSTHRFQMTKDIKSHMPKLLIYAALIVGIYMLANRYAMVVPIDQGVFSIVVAIVILPLFIGLAYWLDKIVWEGIILNIVPSKIELNSSKFTRELFHNISRFIVVVFTGLIFVSLASSIAPAIPWVMSLVILVVASGFSLMRSVMNIHEHIERTILGIMDFEKPMPQQEAKSTHDQLLDLIKTNYPLSFETHDFILPFEPCGLNRSIKEIDLRHKTGASIVGIYRSEEVISNPSSDVVLLPADVIVLIGNEAQIKGAIAYLRGKVKDSL